MRGALENGELMDTFLEGQRRTQKHVWSIGGSPVKRWRWFFLLLGSILIELSLKGTHVAAQTDSHPPSVHLVLFWMNGCHHCHEVLEKVLPPLWKNYGTPPKF